MANSPSLPIISLGLSFLTCEIDASISTLPPSQTFRMNTLGRAVWSRAFPSTRNLAVLFPLGQHREHRESQYFVRGQDRCWKILTFVDSQALNEVLHFRMCPFVSVSPGVLTLQLSAVVGRKPWALSGTAGPGEEAGQCWPYWSWRGGHSCRRGTGPGEL